MERSVSSKTPRGIGSVMLIVILTPARSLVCFDASANWRLTVGLTRICADFCCSRIPRRRGWNSSRVTARSSIARGICRTK